MRIVAGAWRGRTLVAPPGQGTRPTADRVRQALFDMLMHADWGGRPIIEGAVVLDVFAGTGALGLEALSRGAAWAWFVESDPIALHALRTNVVACKAQNRSQILAADALGLAGLSSFGNSREPAQDPETYVTQPAGQVERRLNIRAGMTPLPAAQQDEAQNGVASLVFLDPPYGRDLVPRALLRLTRLGRIGSNALIVAETGRDETWVPEQPVLAERQYGAARVMVFRVG